MANIETELFDGVAHYYAQKLAAHGDTPRGVDWNGETSQILRFEQLCKIIPGDADCFSLTDLGCGYGALFDFLQAKPWQFTYLGVDISDAMVSAARARNAGQHNARFVAAHEPDALGDYCVASGIFNVRLGWSNPEWFDYLSATIDVLDRNSALGFAFNCLSSYSDLEKRRDDLYYADPCQLFDLCKRKYSTQVALLHDYGLYEFTILVRKAT